VDETTIKTEPWAHSAAVLAEAIQQIGFKSIQNYQYDPTCEKPDFLIPDQKNLAACWKSTKRKPRNSFQMKTLRAFTAVMRPRRFMAID